LVWLLSATHGVNEFFSLVAPPLFPFLLRDGSLGLSYADASLLVVAFFLTYSVFQLPVGRLVDVYSPRRLLVVGQLVLSVGVALVAVAPGYGTMLAGMVVVGLGGSTYHPTGMSVISDAEGEATHGRSMGIHGMLGTFGTVLAPVAVGGVAVAAGWRTALLAAAGAGVAFAVALAVLYPRAAPDAVDPDRSLLAAVRSEFGGGRSVSLAARTGAFLRSPGMLVLVALFVVVGAEVRAVQSFTNVFASRAVGGDATFGNRMLALTMVAAGVASTAAGYGVDRVDRRLFAGASFALTAVVVAAVAVLPLGRVGLAAAFAVLGVVMYSVYPATNALAAALSTEDSSGSVFAVTQTAAALGGAAGPFLLGVVADAGGIAAGFLSTAGIAAVGVGVVVAAALLE
jgi:MFS family permease